MCEMDHMFPPINLPQSLFAQRQKKHRSSSLIFSLQLDAREHAGFPPRHVPRVNNEYWALKSLPVSAMLFVLLLWDSAADKMGTALWQPHLSRFHSAINF